MINDAPVHSLSPLITAASPFGRKPFFFWTKARSMCATVGTPFVDKILRLVDYAYTNCVEWHVAEGDKVGHLKHIVTVRRNACCRLQLESEHLIFNPLCLVQRNPYRPRLDHFLFAIKDSRDACATAPGISTAMIFTISS